VGISRSKCFSIVAGPAWAIADLTGQNLNVFYEVGLRHALRRPVILIADDAEAGRLPFDLLQQRTIFFGDTLEGAADCRRTASEQIRAALAGHVDSPVGAAMSVGLLEQGTDVERTLAELVKRVESLGEVVAVAAHPGTAVPQQLNLDVLGGFTAVLEEVNAIGDDELRERLKETVANAFYPMLQFIWGRYRPHDERDESGATNADAEGQPTNPPESSTGSERLG
jgi:hypothetical protein